MQASAKTADRWPHIAAITGLAGIGKTQLCVEYCHRYATDFRVVWWVQSATSTAIVAGISKLAGELGLSDGILPDKEISVSAVKRWLRDNGRWLLVFDDAQGPQELYEFIPDRGNGIVLITSRNPSWDRIALTQDLPPLRVEDSARFLRNRTGQQDVTAARSLSDRVGGLPLALEQAAPTYAERELL